MPNLLQKASIVLTPTAYDNGKVLCAKPSEAPYGDFDFSRNSAATRVNAQGLVEDVQILSSNLVQNGDFSEQGAEEVSNGSFSQQGSELVTNGDFATNINFWEQYQSLSTWDNGTIKTTCTIVNTWIRQNDILSTNNIYKITFKAKATNISKNIKIWNGTTFVDTGLSFDTINEYKNFTYFLDFSGGGGQHLIIGQQGLSIGDSINIDNVSVVEVGQDWNLGTGWSLGEDKAECDGTNIAYLTQTSILNTGTSYKVQFDIVDYTSGSVKYRDNGLVSGQSFSGVGSYTDYVVAGGGQFRLMSENFIGSITNISVKEVGQNWSLNNGATIGDDKAIISGDGSAFTHILQSGVFTSGKQYQVKVDVVINSGLGLKFQDGANNENIGFATTSGAYTFYFTATSNSTILIGRRTGGAAFNSSVTNIKIIEITDDTNLPRINYEGFSFQDALGSELVTNGDFATDLSDWTGQVGRGNYTWDNGKAKITNNETSSYPNLSQSIPTIVGKIYKIKAKVEIGTATLVEVRAYSGSILGNQQINTDGEIEFNITAVSTDFLLLLYLFETGNTGNYCYFDNVSVKEYKGQEVVPDSGCGSWLFEPQSTNLLPYSEDFSQWTLGGSTTIESGYLAPDGTNNAYKVSNANSALTLPASLLTTTTRSIYARTTSGTGQANLCSFNSNTNNLFTITEQWQRFDVNSAIATGVTSFYAVDFRGGTNLSEIILWGANATNDQDYPTSYIPTYGTTVTRNQDVCTNGGSVSTINSTEGVLYAEIAALADDGTNRVISLSDGSTSNRVSIVLGTGSNQIRGQVLSSGTSFDFSTTSYDTLNKNKIAISYKLNDFKMYINGVEVATDTSGNTPIGMNKVSFNAGTTTLPFFGKTKCLAVWKEPLSDEELAELTTV